jgi:hypothetical protein
MTRKTTPCLFGRRGFQSGRCWGAAKICSRQAPGLPVPEGIKDYQAGRSLDEVLLEAYHTTYPG